MTTKAVLFDLDETLMVEEQSNQQSFAVACQLAADKYQLDPKKLYKTVAQVADNLWANGPFFNFLDALGTAYWEGLWGQFTGDWPKFNDIRPWIQNFRTESWQIALQANDIKDPQLAEEIAQTFIDDRTKRHVIFDHAHQVLTELSQKYKIGMITNGVPDLQWCKIKGIDVEKYFQSIVISGEVGLGKPDPQIFNIALEQLDTPADSAVMVGNSLARDIAGAHNANIRSILIDTTDPEAKTNVKPHHTISTLDQLPPLL